MPTITARQLQADTQKIVDRAKAGETFTITRGGRPAAVLDGLATAPPPPPPPPTGDRFPSITDAQAIKLGTFEGGNLTGGQYGFDQATVGTDYPGKAEAVTDRLAPGSKYAMRTTHVAGDMEQGRAELAMDPVPQGSEGVYEFGIYVPASVGFVSAEKGFQIAQHKQGGQGSSCYSGGIACGRDWLKAVVVHACDGHGGETATEHPLGSYPKDRWVGIRVHFKWADSGYLQVDVDAGSGYENRMKRTPCRTVQDTAVGVKHRMGPYGRMSQGAQLWFDSYRLRLG